MGELSLQLNVGATVIQSFLSSLLQSGNEKKKLKRIGKSPVKPNLPISCCFTVKASKLYQNSLHCFYANAVFDGTAFEKAFSSVMVVLNIFLGNCLCNPLSFQTDMFL